MDLEEAEPIEPSVDETCPNPACHCVKCVCGEDCHCSFLERCPCSSLPENNIQPS